MPLTLASIPEEILERILALALFQSSEPSARPSWHPYHAPPLTNHPSLISPLLVSRSWLRIATPIHYRQPILRTARHVELLLRALHHSPALASCIRTLHIRETSPALRALLPLCTNLNTLDVTVDNADPRSPTSPAAATPHAVEPAQNRVVTDFCDAFTKTRSIRHLVIRKNAYLTQPNAIYIFEHLAKAISHSWRRLETVDVAFRLSPSPAANALVDALAVAPRLRTLCTQLPTLWNSTLLDIAQNSALTRIVISPAQELTGAHLFLAEARRHPRLVDLLRAGTPPPAPHPGPFNVACSSRARAQSAAMAPARSAPVPVATWGYERDVPPPACPPVMRRSGGATQSVPGVVVDTGFSAGPSAYSYAHAQGASAYAYPANAHGVQQPHHAHHQHSHSHSQAQAYVSAHQSQQYPAYGGHQYYSHANVAAPVHHQGSLLGGPPPRRSAPGGRRMTAS